MQPQDVTAEHLRSALVRDPVDAADGPTAAVAVVFRGGELGTELLFIQRAASPQDPWSGQMAFPGGRTEPDDDDAHATAERETLEEVGLALTPARRLGRLADVIPGRRLLAVHPMVYWLDGDRPDLHGNYEVADVVWVPLAVLADSSRYIDYFYPVSESSWPGIQLDKPSQVIWGLTLRMLADLFDRLGIDFIDLGPG